MAELTARVTSLQEQLDAGPESIEQQFIPEHESEAHSQNESHTEALISALEEQQQTVAELRTKINFLQEQFNVVSVTAERTTSAEAALETEYQTDSKDWKSHPELEVQRKQLAEEQHKVTELTVRVASLQEQLETAVKQKNNELIDQPAMTVNDSDSSPVGANSKIKRIVEALLFAAAEPMTVKQLQAVFPEIETPEKQLIQEAIDSLCDDYQQQAIALHQVASGYRFQVKQDMAPWVARLFAEKPPRYSRALLETIAIIAYQQPVTRGDIEEIRGVSVSSNMIRTLLEREWIKVLAHKEVPGRPALYGTTKQFLDYFNLPSLDAMPPLEELQALALAGEMEI